MEGPTPWPQVAWWIIGWTILILIIGGVLHGYVTWDPEKEEHRTREVTLWFGGTGFMGAMVIGIITIIISFSFLFIAFYARLVALDVQRLSIQFKQIVNRVLSMTQQFDLLDATKSL
tara:strand:+ start:174 stop:524 length:351 start_codon:yes stop_codon:yes gene_type:complete